MKFRIKETGVICHKKRGVIWGTTMGQIANEHADLVKISKSCSAPFGLQNIAENSLSAMAYECHSSTSFHRIKEITCELLQR